MARFLISFLVWMLINFSSHCSLSPDGLESKPVKLTWSSCSCEIFLEKVQKVLLNGPGLLLIQSFESEARIPGCSIKYLKRRYLNEHSLEFRPQCSSNIWILCKRKMAHWKFQVICDEWLTSNPDSLARVLLSLSGGELFREWPRGILSWPTAHWANKLARPIAYYKKL